jgi:glycosyltransferase A (GT-A) superfamily protein (DUF2064 family)
VSETAPAVLLMPDTAIDDEQDRELERLVGHDGRRELGAALITEARAWANQVAPARVHEADPVARMLDAAERAFETHEGPLLVVWPFLPRLRPEHAAAALGDLAAGCDVVLGPVIDGGLYLLGLARSIPELASIDKDLWRGPDVMGIGLAAARDAGLEVGILRAERALRRPADVRAALADPLLPEEIARILRRSM